MGTRNLTAVICEGKYVIAQYGQWDGYPEGQGNTARKFLRERFDGARFLSQVKRARFVTQEETRKAYDDAGADGSGFVSDKVVKKFEQRFPFINRDHGAEVLQMVQDWDGPIELQDSHDFAVDSLFCEWAYVVDLDRNTFEVYKGFNHSPLPPGERFAGLEPREKSSDGTPYYPVKHVITYPLDSIPNKDEFLRDIKKALPKDEDEEAA